MALLTRFTRMNTKGLHLETSNIGWSEQNYSVSSNLDCRMIRLFQAVVLNHLHPATFHHNTLHLNRLMMIQIGFRRMRILK